MFAVVYLTQVLLLLSILHDLWAGHTHLWFGWITSLWICGKKKRQKEVTLEYYFKLQMTTWERRCNMRKWKIKLRWWQDEMWGCGYMSRQQAMLHTNTDELHVTLSSTSTCDMKPFPSSEHGNSSRAANVPCNKVVTELVLTLWLSEFHYCYDDPSHPCVVF